MAGRLLLIEALFRILNVFLLRCDKVSYIATYLKLDEYHRYNHILPISS